MKLVRSGCPINFGVKGYKRSSVTLRSNVRGCIWVHLSAQMDRKVQVSRQGKVSTLVGNVAGDGIVNASTFAIS